MRKLAFAVLVLGMLAVPQVSPAQYRVVPGIRVNDGPPPVRVEAMPPAPSPRHHWIAGYWAWQGNARAWMPGHWALPPGSGYVWEPARWERVDGRWMFYDGHWHPSEPVAPEMVYQPPAPPADEMVADAAPPPPLVEDRGPPPFAGAYWIGGYWHWTGMRHAWVAGRWTRAPAGFAWEPHRWERRPDGRWTMYPGHWRR
jgi:hypothetical protein